MKLLSDYLNVCDHNPSTLQKDRQTTYDSNTVLRTYVLHTVKKILEHERLMS